MSQKNRHFHLKKRYYQNQIRVVAYALVFLCYYSFYQVKCDSFVDYVIVDSDSSVDYLIVQSDSSVDYLIVVDSDLFVDSA